MNKQEFFAQLSKQLSGLPKKDLEERLLFYGEMIDDRIEDGIPEEEAIAGIGTVDEIVTQIIADTPLVKLAKERMKPQKKLSAFEIVLLALGSPVWLSLLIVAGAVLLAVYVCLWSVILVLWAVFAAMTASGFACVLGGILLAVKAKILTGVATVGAGLFCSGLSIGIFFGCKAATKYILIMTKRLALWLKSHLIRKEKLSCAK